MKNFMDFAQKTFFPKNLLPNSGCGLSTDAAYTRVNTVLYATAKSGCQWVTKHQNMFLSTTSRR